MCPILKRVAVPTIMPQPPLLLAEEPIWHRGTLKRLVKHVPVSGATDDGPLLSHGFLPFRQIAARPRPDGMSYIIINPVAQGP
jgi:hypothetical protein